MVTIQGALAKIHLYYNDLEMRKADITQQEMEYYYGLLDEARECYILLRDRNISEPLITLAMSDKVEKDVFGRIDTFTKMVETRSGHYYNVYTI